MTELAKTSQSLDSFNLYVQMGELSSNDNSLTKLSLSFYKNAFSIAKLYGSPTDLTKSCERYAPFSDARRKIRFLFYISE